MLRKKRKRQIILRSFQLSLVHDSTEVLRRKFEQIKGRSSHSVNSIRCGVCIVVIDEVLYELRKTENSTSTLDLRWGLTAEVTEGRSLEDS